MPTIKLTKRVIDELQADPKDVFYWDSDIKGLAVKVTPKNKKTFVVQYRVAGRGTPTRKMSLGPYGSVTLHKARIEAKKILGLRADGRDPALERQQEKRRAVSDRFGEVALDFLEMYASRNRTADETARIIRRDVFPAWEKRSIHGIGKRDVNDLLDIVVSRGSHFMANRLLAALRKLFNWCISRGIITESPCAGISAPHKEEARDRVLTDAELVSIINATREIGGAFGGIIQTLIFTAQRRNEVSRTPWEELDLASGTWTLPGARTKNGKSHIVHVSGQAKLVFEAMPENGIYVFTSNGKTPFSGFSKAKKKLDDISGVTDWRLHDLRRTVTTGMAALGIAPHIADKIMNHQSGTISGVAAVYQRHEFLDERRTALEAWGNYVETLIDDRKPGNVLNLHNR